MYNTIMEIKTATDWQLVYKNLRTELHSIGYNPDLTKLVDNIATMVTELSKLEVEARRSKNTSKVLPQIKLINQAISRLESLLLMAKLMK